MEVLKDVQVPCGWTLGAVKLNFISVNFYYCFFFVDSISLKLNHSGMHLRSFLECLIQNIYEYIMYFRIVALFVDPAFNSVVV